MTRQEFHDKIENLILDTEVEALDGAFVPQWAAEITTNRIIAFLRTVYDLEELVH